MLLDAFAGGTIKVKTTDEVRELIDNMSLNEYRGQHEEEATPRKKGMIDLNTQDALLVSNKLLSIQLETTSKRLEAREDSQLSANTNWHLPASSWKWAKCMGNYSRQQRNPYSNTYNPGWAVIGPQVYGNIGFSIKDVESHRDQCQVPLSIVTLFI